MADYNVLTDYGYFTIENDKEGDELWFHPLRGEPLKMVDGKNSEEQNLKNRQLLKEIGENNTFKITYKRYKNKNVYLDGINTTIEPLSDEDKAKIEIRSDNNIKTYTGKYRIDDGKYFFDIESVDGENKRIPSVWLFTSDDKQGDTPDQGKALIISNINKDALEKITPGEVFDIIGKISTHRRTNNLCIYFSNKETLIVRQNETAEEVSERNEKQLSDRLKACKTLKTPFLKNAKGEDTFLCDVKITTSVHSDNKKRKEVIRKLLEDRTRRGFQWTGPGKLVPDNNLVNDDIRLDVYVFGQQIGCVPKEKTEEVLQNMHVQGDSVLVNISCFQKRDKYYVKLYTPDTAPSEAMEKTVNDILETASDLTPPKKTFIDYSVFLDEQLGGSKEDDSRNNHIENNKEKEGQIRTMPEAKKRLLIQRGFTEEEIDNGFRDPDGTLRWSIETISAEALADSCELEELAKLFKKDSVRPDWGAPHGGMSFEKYSSLFESEEGKYLSASTLDPYIARLIIAANKCCIFTSMSCDGWHDNNTWGNNLRIGMSDEFSKVWFCIIAEKIFGNNSQDDKYDGFMPDSYDFLDGFSARIRVIYRISKNNEARDYQMINNYAAFLEQFSNELCGIREKWIAALLSKYSCNELDTMNYDELKNAILENVDETALKELAREWKTMDCELREKAREGIQSWSFVCPKCGGEMVIKTNRRTIPERKFLGCVNYQKTGCKGTRNIED